MRQFQFEIRDLFGCSDKPFSCDVEIRYADQMTVLPIEVQVCTWHYLILWSQSDVDADTGNIDTTVL